MPLVRINAKDKETLEKLKETTGVSMSKLLGRAIRSMAAQYLPPAPKSVAPSMVGVHTCYDECRASGHMIHMPDFIGDKPAGYSALCPKCRENEDNLRPCYDTAGYGMPMRIICECTCHPQ